MKVTSGSRLNIRLQNVLFVILFLGLIGLAGWLAQQYKYQADWTASGRNTLSDATVTLLERMDGEISMTAFTSDGGALKKHISSLIEAYRRHKSDIALEFINPDTEPERVRELGITLDGEIVLEYQGRSENLTELSEQGLTNALKRLLRSAERILVFVEGHGERSPFKQANHDLQIWGAELEKRGFHLQGVNLAAGAVIPENAGVLIIAGPQVDYLPGEVEMIADYLRGGGSLLWLAEPEGLYGLDAVAEQLGFELEPGVIVDPTTQMLSINNPTFAIVADYGMHPVTLDFDVLTLFPRAAGVAVEEQDTWQAEPLLTTAARSWSETGELNGEVFYDMGEDVPGPLSIGVVMTRNHNGESVEDNDGGVNGDSGAQRVIVMGDGDFVSNTYLGNGGNLDLAISMVNWLSSDDKLVSIPARTALDTSLIMSETQMILIGFGFLLALPAMLFGAGLWIWLRRRRA